MANEFTPSALFADDQPAVQVATQTPTAPLTIDLQAAPATNLPATVDIASNLPSQLTTQFVDTYGRDVMKSGSSVSDKIITSMTADHDDVMIQKLEELLAAAKGLDPKAMLKVSGFMGKLTSMLSAGKEGILNQFRSTQTKIDLLKADLMPHVARQSQHVGEFEQMFNENVITYQKLEVLVKQGRELIAAEEAAIASVAAPTDAMGAQMLSDRRALLNRFQKNVADLDAAMTLAFQAGPQIRMMQQNSRSLVDKFNNLMDLTLPAFKSQFAIYLMQADQKKSADVADKMDDAFNEAIKANADALRVTSAQVAKSAERQIVDLSTIEHVQQQLIGSVEDVLKIRRDATAARAAGAAQLTKLRGELVSRLTAAAA